MKKINVGIIGTGFISFVHIEAIRRLGYAEVTAIAGSTQEKARAVATSLHIPFAYGDYRELLADPSIDVVHNCTPNHLHHEINKAIMKANKHVLSEKPLTTTPQESKELVQLLNTHPVLHGVHFNYRQYPVIQHIKATLSQQTGPIHLVHGHYLQDWMLHQTDYNWRLHPEKGGNLRTIGDIGSHWIDLLQYLLNQKVTAVFADKTTLFPTRIKPKGNIETFQSHKKIEGTAVPVGTEDFATILLQFEKGTKGVVTVSQVSAGRKNQLSFELNGKHASLSWNQEEPNSLWIGHRDKANELLVRDPQLLHPTTKNHVHYPGGHNEGWADGIKNMMNEFYTYVKEKRTFQDQTPSFATFNEGHYMMCILDAIEKSTEQGKWIEVHDHF